MGKPRLNRARAAEDLLLPGVNAPGFNAGLLQERVQSAALWFRDCLAREVEHRTGFLWLPVAFGLGIALYFAAAEEPRLWAGTGLALLALPFAIQLSGAARMVAIALLFVASGFAAGTIRSANVASPMLARDFFGTVKAYVEAVDIVHTRQRLTLRPVSMEGLTEKTMPFRIRVGAPGRTGYEPGALVSVRVRLMPPSEAAMPGGYDFRRDAYFHSIGGVGYTIGAAKPEALTGDAPLDLTINARIDQWRNALTMRIATAIGGDSGALSAALITGKRGLISEQANDDMRGAGLYHIVSISGLHMVLAAGVMFWSLRALLAAFPGIALRYPIKKIAAAAAMVGAFAYCTFSGAEVATVRSLIMTLVMLGAILVDRPALAMRNLAISALIVLAREPDSLLGPSFQMSFSAVACLIAANRVWLDWRRGKSASEGSAWRRGSTKLLLAFAGIGATTLIATLATAPFSAYHFHRLNPYGLIGNSLGIPLVSLIVMPCAVAGTLLVPFGLDGIVWRIMGEGVSGVLAVSKWVAAIENASVTAPQIVGLTFGLMVAALLIFVGFRTALRWLSLVPLTLGFVMMPAPDLPDIVIDPTARMALMRAGDGRYRLLAPGPISKFTLAQWLPALDDNRMPDALSLKEGIHCDKAGCTGNLRDGRVVALVAKRDALRDDCLRADIVITPLAGIAACQDRKLLARAHFDTFGATLIRTANPATWRLETTLDPRVDRPWRRKMPPPKPATALARKAETLERPSLVRPETLDDDPALSPGSSRAGADNQ
jgi:competence protein ComEC